MLTTARTLDVPSDGDRAGRLRGEVAEARAACRAAAFALVAVCDDPRSSLSSLAEAARAMLDAAGWLSTSAHLLATDSRR